MTNQQLAEAIVNKLKMYLAVTHPGPHTDYMTAAILPLIAEFKKEVAGEAWDASYKYEVLGYDIPDRETYIDNLNK